MSRKIRLPWALYALILASGWALPVQAQVAPPLDNACTCTCVDGRPLQVCTQPGSTQICGPQVCPPTPAQPLLTPQTAQPTIPICHPELAYNEQTRKYEYHQVCK